MNYVVQDTRSANGTFTRTIAIDQGATYEYLTETFHDGVVINRARNRDPFHAGMAHMAFHLSWSQATDSNLKQAAIEARGETGDLRRV